MLTPAPGRGNGPEDGGGSDGGCGQGPLGPNWKGSTTGRVTRSNPTGAPNWVEIQKDASKLSGILQQNNTQVQQKLDGIFTTKTKDTEDKPKDINTDTESPQKKPKSNTSPSSKAEGTNWTESTSEKIWVQYVTRDACPFLKEEIEYAPNTIDDLLRNFAAMLDIF